MKFLLILACLVLYLAITEAQENCQGKPRKLKVELLNQTLFINIFQLGLRQDCLRGKDEGNFNERSCRRNANANMWYYDERSRECHKMHYHGCGGNRNRFCSLNHCKSHCRR
ncbi:hypothetical protein KR009_003032 [Drosophila setifemur]|nr:hypothetical protein KR009_003032 [Drosophila setifemur]